MTARIVMAGALLLVAITVIVVLSIRPGAPAPGAGAPRMPVSDPVPRPGDAFAMTIESVHDGDSLRARVDSPNAVVTTTASVRVRLIGLDAPEVSPDVECWAIESRDRLRELVPEGSTVWAAPDREALDRYDRHLLYLWTDDDVFVNYELVAAGDAEVLRVRPNDAYADLFSEAEREARDAGAGQWGACAAEIR